MTCFYEYLLSDVMDVLNIYEVMSWVFEYLCSDVMDYFEYSFWILLIIHEVTLWVFKIPMTS